MARFTKSAALVLCAAVLIASAQENTLLESAVKKRNALAIASGEPLYRDAVDELMGGKTPESLMNRLELNEIDAMGLMEPGAEVKATQLKDMPLDEKVQTRQLPHRGYPHTFPQQGPYAPPHPAPGYHQPEPYHPPPTPGYHKPEPYHPPVPTPTYGHPEPAYGHPKPEYGHPEPGYGPPKPYAPKEPVLLAKRPHEVKEIRPVEIVTHDTYTNFDCRGKNYEHFYADVEADCKIYHVCHSHGKQDTFHCPYGTIFNEYIGTCDHTGAAVCHSGPGYAKPDPPPKKPGYHPPHAGYHEPAPYHPPAPHPHHAEPYHPSPAPYHPTPAYHPPTPAPYHSPDPYAPSPYAPQGREYDAPFVHF